MEFGGHDQISQTLSDIQLLYHTSRSIAAAVDVDDVIAAYLDQVARGDRYACNIVLYNRGEDDAIVSRTLHGTWKPDIGLVFMRESFQYERDNLDDELDLGQTIRINNVTTDPRVPEGLSSLQARDGRPSLALIPLNVGDRRVGLVTLSFHEPHEWTDSELRPYEVTAAQLSLALLRRLEADHHRERGQKLLLLEERNRLARDLHDSVTQLLFSLNLMAQSTRQAWTKDPQEGFRRMDRVVDLSERALGEMRALLSQLRGQESLDSGTLSDQLALLADDLRSHDLEVTLTTNDITVVKPEFVYAVARVAQEAMSNALKHSQCHHVAVTLSQCAAAIRLEVTDDGIGISTSQRDGMGMSTMRERAEMLNGTLSVEPANPGTRVRLTLPIHH